MSTGSAQAGTDLRIITRGYGVETIDGVAHRVNTLETSDGRHWRECLGPELSPDILDPDILIFFGRGTPKPARVYADWKVAGHPFLHGLCMLGIPIYIEQKCPECGASPCPTYQRGGHRPRYCWCGKRLPDENCHRWHGAPEEAADNERAQA